MQRRSLALRRKIKSGWREVRFSHSIVQKFTVFSEKQNRDSKICRRAFYPTFYSRGRSHKISLHLNAEPKYVEEEDRAKKIFNGIAALLLSSFNTLHR
jgi:hypothetical protein